MSERDIFLAAIDLPDGERSAYLDRACGADADLRARVDGLLRSHEAAGSFLNEPAADPADAATVAFTPTPAAEMEEDDEVPLGFLDPPGRPDSLGRIGHYEVLQVLGKGGFGIVFRAFDDTLQRVVAVKVLSPQMATTSPARKRFLREARSSAAVRHENVVHVHTVEEQPLPYLVMDYIPGETLQQRIKRVGPLELAEAVRIGRQVAAGLAAAHATGLIHRDIKPSNILLDTGPHPVAKITDFGLARAADDASLTRSGTVAGTPMYMSPEQARGEPLDHRSDLFSLGSVLYALVTGRPPFRAETTLAVLKRVAEDTPRPIREVIPEVPGWFCRVVDKLHAKDPAERFQSAQEVADLLADCERQVEDGNKLTDYARIPGGPPTHGRAWGWAVAGVVLVLVALNAAFAVWQEEWNGTKSMQYATAIGILIAVLGVGASVWSRRVAKRGDRPRARRWRALVIAGCVLMVGNLGVFAYKLNRLRDHIRDVLNQDDGAGGNASPRPEKPPASDGDFTPLFNGQDLAGWKTHPNDKQVWSVVDGAIVGPRGSRSHLFTERDDFADFHLRAEAKVNATGVGGVCFRSLLPPPTVQTGAVAYTVEGYYAQIGVSADAPIHTGSLSSKGKGSPATGFVVNAPPNSHPPDEWFTLEVVARGNHIQVLVNGTVTADHRDGRRLHRRGHIALRTWRADVTDIRFRKIEIRELPAANPPTGLQPLRDKVTAAQAARDLTRTKFDVGTVSGIEMARADGDLADAKAELAAAEGDRTAALTQVGELRKQRQLERERVGLRAKEGLEKPEVVLDADARLRAAWGRAAQLGLEPERPTAPFDAKQAKEYQEAWAKRVGEKVEFADKTLGMEFRVIPPGEFLMGAADAEVRDDIDRAKKSEHPASKFLARALEANLPQHKVRISRPFAIGKYEVTVGQFRKFVEDDKYRPTGPTIGGYGLVGGELVKGKDKEFTWDKVGYDQSDLHPVMNVSAEDAAEFCKWLSNKDGRTYRLPTEAEWEWACRGGTSGPTFFPPNEIHLYAALPVKTGRQPQPVGGTRRPNPFGLYDTCGNVWEWCSDWYSEGYYKTLPADTPTSDPTGPTGPDKRKENLSHRVQRGGSALKTAGYATSSNGRGFGEQEGCGFRVMCELVPK